MKYTVHKQDRYTVFTLEDKYLNSIIAPDLKSEFFILSNEGVKNLIFNLSKVQFADSSGLSAILTANRLWKDNGLFIVAGMENPNVKKLIEISRLDTILTIIPTIDEAVDYLYMEELERELNAEGD